MMGDRAGELEQNKLAHNDNVAELSPTALAG
jgi:hypothetical protein